MSDIDVLEKIKILSKQNRYCGLTDVKPKYEVVKCLNRFPQGKRFDYFISVPVSIQSKLKGALFLIAEPLYKEVIKKLRDDFNMMLMFSSKTVEFKNSEITDILGRGQTFSFVPKNHTEALISGRIEVKNSNDWAVVAKHNLEVTETKSEDKAYNILVQNAGVRNVSRQKLFVIDGTKYFPDLLVKKYKLVIEIDGAIHKKADRVKHDLERDNRFYSIGYKTVRFTNDEVKRSDFRERLKNVYFSRVAEFNNTRKSRHSAAGGSK